MIMTPILNLKDYRIEQFLQFSTFLNDIKTWLGQRIQQTIKNYHDVEMIISLILTDDENFRNSNKIIHLFRLATAQNRLFIIYDLVFRFKFLRRRNFENIIKDLDTFLDLVFTYRDPKLKYTSKQALMYQYYFSKTEDIISKRYKGLLTTEKITNKNVSEMLLEYLIRLKKRDTILDYVGLAYVSMMVLLFVSKSNEQYGIWFKIFKMLIEEFTSAKLIEILQKIMYFAINLDNKECMNLLFNCLKN